MDKFEIDLAMFEELIWLVESYRGYKLCLLTLSTFFLIRMTHIFIGEKTDKLGLNSITEKKTCTTWINGQLIGDKHSVIAIPKGTNKNQHESKYKNISNNLHAFIHLFIIFHALLNNSRRVNKKCFYEEMQQNIIFFTGHKPLRLKSLMPFITNWAQWRLEILIHTPLNYFSGASKFPHDVFILHKAHC